MPKHAQFSKRQAITVGILVCVVFVFGIMLGSITKLGSSVRGVLYGSRGEIDLTTTQEIYGILRNNFDGTLTTTSLQDGANRGLVAATGDRYSGYLTPAETAARMERMNGNGFIGIGVELGFKNGALVIIAAQDGSPAEQAGIKAGDTIVKIDGVAVSSMSEEAAVQSLRGERGSTVTLTIERDKQLLELAITRQPIAVASVRWSITDENVGIMTITTFDNNTARLAREAATEFSTRNVRGIVLDMRGNPGGAVTAAQGVLSLWVPKGSLVMTEKRSDTVLRTYKTEAEPLVGNVKTIILMNGGSASASEVVAGALRDYNKASIMGTQSFGKGSVQEIRRLTNGGSLVFTVSRWFTPSGKTIDGRGITPDVVVEQANNGNDSQLTAALQKLR